MKRAKVARRPRKRRTEQGPAPDDPRLKPFLKHLADVGFVGEAAALAGIPRSTITHWLARGSREIILREQGQEPNRDNESYVSLLRKVDAVRSTLAAQQLRLLRRHGKNDWRASAHYLQILNPKRFGPQDGRRLAEEEIQRFIDRLQRANPCCGQCGAPQLDAILTIALAEDEPLEGSAAIVVASKAPGDAQ